MISELRSLFYRDPEINSVYVLDDDVEKLPIEESEMIGKFHSIDIIVAMEDGDVSAGEFNCGNMGGEYWNLFRREYGSLEVITHWAYYPNHPSK